MAIVVGVMKRTRVYSLSRNPKDGTLGLDQNAASGW
jgi:hypothetical protein